MKVTAKPLEELLKGVRINSRHSLLKMTDIIDIYSKPATRLNVAVYFSEDYTPPKDKNQRLSIATFISLSKKELVWREEFSHIMRFKYDTYEDGK
jgi:hypothetical protein